jgi:hypothetical protein
MVSSDLIDIVIGVVFAWFLLSLIVSFVGEAFTYLSKTRSKLLWRSLSQIFDSNVKAADGRLRSLLFRVPFGRDDIRPVAKTEPSFGSNKRKTLSMTDEAAPATDKTPLRPVDALYDVLRRRVPDPASKNWRTRISQVPTKVIGDALLSLASTTVTRQSVLASLDESSSLRQVLEDHPDAFDAAKADKTDEELRDDVVHKLGLLSGAQIAEFESGWERAKTVVTLEDIEALLAGNPRLVARVRAAAKSVETSQQVQKAREEIERWFDGAMEGLSAFYRRQSRKLLAIVALIVVMLSNSGAFRLYQRLHDDNDLRAASASAAAGWAAQPLTSDDGSAIDLAAACARISDVASGSTPTSEAANTTSTAPASTTTTTIDPVVEARRRFKCAGQLFASTDLLTPVGPHALWTEIRNANKSDGLPRDVVSWVGKSLPGRIVTWVALLFGASFWYDALRRLIGLKGKLAGGGASSGET